MSAVEDGARCSALASAGSPSLEIRLAVVDALPDGRTACRVEAIARPRPEAHIGIEVWLPTPSRWSGRYYQMGNGGFAGWIHRPTLAAAAARGDVAAATDTGHQAGGFDAGWAAGRPDLIVDYAFRSIKVTYDVAGLLIRRYYGAPARRRYFMGCSYGGRQALVAAARWPRDWDGVIAGAPAFRWPETLTAFGRIARAAAAGRARLNRALRSEGYLPAEIGAEDWRTWIAPTDHAAPSQRRLAIEAHRHLFGAGPRWTPEQASPTGNPVPPALRLAFATGSLSRYLQSGGKVLVYFGRADPVLPPLSAIEHRRRLEKEVGAQMMSRGFRLFLIPGMGHCQGGSAPHAIGQSIATPAARDEPKHDVRRALERWVEQGPPPDVLVAGSTRPGPRIVQTLRPVGAERPSREFE